MNFESSKFNTVINFISGCFNFTKQDLPISSSLKERIMSIIPTKNTFKFPVVEEKFTQNLQSRISRITDYLTNKMSEIISAIVLVFHAIFSYSGRSSTPWKDKPENTEIPRGSNITPFGNEEEPEEEIIQKSSPIISPQTEESIVNPSQTKRSIAERLEDNRRDATTQQQEETHRYFFSSDSQLLNSEFFEQPLQISSSPQKGIGITSTIGYRPKMEDQEIAAIGNLQVHDQVFPFRLFGVFDGHGGSDVSLFVKTNIETYLAKALRDYNKECLTKEGIFLALKKCFVDLDNDLPPGIEDQGTTATVALLINDNIWIANVGDARTILVKENGETIQASEDAKPGMPKYKKKIEKLGGAVFYIYGTPRVNGSLSVARAIGDKQIKQNPYADLIIANTSNVEEIKTTTLPNGCSISPNPKITCYPSVDFANGYLVLACDGLYDVASTNEVGRAIQIMAKSSCDPQHMSKALVRQALNESRDNITVAVVRL